jgi:aryl-alcohol dehydrogenase-like predicted oxidoreductase
MEQRRFGWTDRSVAVIGQGTWNIDRSDRASAIAALRRGIDLGLTHIDTAEMYGDAEAMIAPAIAGRRDDVFLVSKVLPTNASRRGTLRACERSLARLGTHWLDCYLLHWRGRHPLEDTIAAFEQLVAEGKIRSWGVSNFDASDLDEARTIAGERRIACNQVLYHLQERAIEHTVIPWCERTTSPSWATARSAAVASRSAERRRARPRTDRRVTRCDAAPGGARLPRPVAVRRRDSEGVDTRPRRRQRRRRTAPADGRRPHRDRPRLSSRSTPARAADALMRGRQRTTAMPHGFRSGGPSARISRK